MFPGESEIDQLYIIQKVIGPLPPEQMHLFNLNPRFRGLKFPTAIKPLTLKQKYQHSMPNDLLTFLESTLKLEARKRLTIDQCANHVAFQILRGEASEKENRNEESDSGTEGSWKEIQLEEPCDDSRDDSFVSNESKPNGRLDGNEVNNGKNKQIDQKYETMQKQAQIAKITVLDKKENSMEIGASNGTLNEPTHRQYSSQLQDVKNFGKDHSLSKGSEARNTKAPNHRKGSTDIKLEIGALTKQYYGKYNKVSLTNNGFAHGKISANNMMWSTQQSSSGQRSFHPKGPYGHIQNQALVSYVSCFER